MPKKTKNPKNQKYSFLDKRKLKLCTTKTKIDLKINEINFQSTNELSKKQKHQFKKSMSENKRKHTHQ